MSGLDWVRVRLIATSRKAQAEGKEYVPSHDRTFHRPMNRKATAAMMNRKAPAWRQLNSSPSTHRESSESAPEMPVPSDRHEAIGCHQQQNRRHGWSTAPISAGAHIAPPPIDHRRSGLSRQGDSFWREFDSPRRRRRNSRSTDAMNSTPPAASGLSGNQEEAMLPRRSSHDRGTIGHSALPQNLSRH